IGCGRWIVAMLFKLQLCVLVRRPFDVPFAFELFSVFIKDAVIMSCADKFAERCLAEMMYEGVRRADHSIALLFYAYRIIVVLENPYAESFLEFADFLKHTPPHGDTKHGQHVDVSDPSVIAPGLILSELFHLRPGPVTDFQLGFIPDEVCDRAD